MKLTLVANLRGRAVPKNKGDVFRDVVADFLRAAGFGQVETEQKVQFKKADISATWTRQTIDGPVTYAIEAKNYDQTVGLDECSLFVAQYGELVRAGTVDRAWLISRGPVSPEGQKLIRNAQGRNLDCLTFSELQRRLLVLDSYLADLSAQLRESGIGNYYVEPYLTDDTPLTPLVMSWLDARDSNQLAIFGDYGQGKSTFALYLANKLLEAAKTDPNKRLPVVIPLGEIFDEQSIEGLFGKLLTSKHRVENYHFHLLSALNEQGRLVLIFDGFDEMKHGMTFAMFQNNVSEIMRLDKGQAKIIILGRDTIFANDHEFKFVVLGRQFTKYGQEVPSRTRRALRHVKLRGFSVDESKLFVERYFPERLRTITPVDKCWSDPLRIADRIRQICEHTDLIRRPVHAQMLCDIATDPAISLTAMSAYRLYDVFIHYLIDRETSKKGRFRGFGFIQRRKFSELLAWHLWQAGGASTTTYADIPNDLLWAAVGEARHEFDDEGLRRELLIGCMVEKSSGGIFFPHRSIQEFLVAEHIWTELNSLSERGFSEAGTAEVLEFIVQRIELDRHGEKKRDRSAAKFLSRLLSGGRRLDGIVEFRRAFRVALCLNGKDVDGIKASANGHLVVFFAHNGSMTFDLRTSRAAKYMKTSIEELHLHPERAAPILYLWLMLSRSRNVSEEEISEVVFQLLPRGQLARNFKSMGNPAEQIGALTIKSIPKDRETLGLWFFYKYMKFITETETGREWIHVDRDNAIKDLRSRGIGYDEIEVPPPPQQLEPLKCRVNKIETRLAATNMETEMLSKVMSFLTDAAVRERFTPQ
jgi:NACHT domain/Restriction endonuclease